MTDKTMKRSTKLKDNTMERMNTYFEAQRFHKQISDKACENQRMFLSFASFLRGKKSKSEYSNEQLKNVLLLYIDVFNTLLLDFDYMYYGTIRTQYQNTEATKFLYQDDRGTWKSKASFIWLETEGNFLIKKKNNVDGSSKNRFKAIRALNEHFGSFISNAYRKSLKDDIKEMEESGFLIHETKDDAFQISLLHTEVKSMQRTPQTQSKSAL